MALSNINILRQEGGLGRPIQSQDGISGLLFYSDEAYAPNVNEGQFKLFDAVDVEGVLGITGDSPTVSGGSVIKYHVEEYFRQSDNPLYVNLIASASSDYSEIKKLKDFAEGEIRQLGIYDKGTDFDTANITAIQAIAEECENEKTPLQIVYSSELPVGDTVEDLADLKALESNRVSVVVGQDASEGSKALELASEASLVGMIGTTLGTVSSASVEQNIGWVARFNLVGAEFQTPGFIDGSLVKDKSQTFLNTLDGYHYTFLRKFVGSNGTYHNYSYTTTLSTSDFNTIENNRTYDKAFRLLRTRLLPAVNSPLYVANDGTLDLGTIKYFKSLGESALKQMADAGEVSSFTVNIDPAQNVLSTSKVEITAKIIPVGVAKTIEVKLGFALSV